MNAALPQSETTVPHREHKEEDLVAPELLTSESGMPRKEIELRLQAGILAAREELTNQSRKELDVINLELNKINLHNVSVGHTLANLQQGQIDLHDGQADLANKVETSHQALNKRMDSVEATTNEILDKVKSISLQTITIEQETEDGRTVVKHFMSWKTAWCDIRASWKEILAAYVAYKLLGGWLVERGITWASIFAPRR